MSEDKGSKTEKATPKKLRDARKKGQVAKSKDVVSTTILIFLLIYFIIAWGFIQDHLKVLLLSPNQLILLDLNIAIAAFVDAIYQEAIWGIIVPVSILTILGGIIGNLIQTGFLFSVDPILPKMNKISPVSGFKRIFSMKQLKTTGIGVLKVIAICFGIYFIVLMFLEKGTYYLSMCNVSCQQNIIGFYTKVLIEIIFIITLFLSIIDYIVQRAEFLKEQKMSKDEQKREYKNMEGDPHIKSKRKQIQREISNDDTNKKVKDSRVIIYSSGLAIALQYNEGEDPLPIIKSIGKAKMADKMIEIARAEKVPMYESLELVLSIIKNNGAIDQYIPDESVNGVVLALKKTKI